MPGGGRKKWECNGGRSVPIPLSIIRFRGGGVRGTKSKQWHLCFISTREKRCEVLQKGKPTPQKGGGEGITNLRKEKQVLELKKQARSKKNLPHKKKTQKKNAPPGQKEKPLAPQGKGGAFTLCAKTNEEGQTETTKRRGKSLFPSLEKKQDKKQPLGKGSPPCVESNNVIGKSAPLKPWRPKKEKKSHQIWGRISSPTDSKKKKNAPGKRKKKPQCPKIQKLAGQIIYTGRERSAAGRRGRGGCRKIISETRKKEMKNLLKNAQVRVCQGKNNVRGVKGKKRPRKEGGKPC